MSNQYLKLLFVLIFFGFQLQITFQQEEQTTVDQEEIAEQLEEIAQRDAEKQEKYQQYRDRINQRYENHEDEVEEAEEYENPIQVLDEIFEDAIEENHRKRIGLEKEQVSSEEQEKIKEDDIHILKTNEIFIKAWHKIYKEKLNQLISNDTIAKQITLVNEARYYLLGEISTTSVNITGEIKSISSSQCEDEHCDECFHYTPSKCKVCNYGYALTESLTCTDTCSSGYYKQKIHDVLLCIKCNPICKECTETETKCVSCFPNRLLENQACVEDCSVGYYLENGQCLKCSGNNHCTTYIQNSCGCLSCGERFVLQDNKCLSECKEIKQCANYNENCGCTECIEGYFYNPNTQSCELYPKDCAEYKKLMGEYFKDGIYKIYLPLDKWSFDVYCQDEWIVLERRVESNLSFNQNWTTYEEGFGELDDAFWLGLKKMHAVTAEPKTMQVDLWLNQRYEYAMYYGFTIGDRSTAYALNYYYFAGGKAGDSFYYQKGMKFSTYDQDNDRNRGNCATQQPGGWWYNSCCRVNLNGNYGDSRSWQGINYESFNGHHNSLTKAIMKIK